MPSLPLLATLTLLHPTTAKLADRSRLVQSRGTTRDAGLAIEGAAYRAKFGGDYNKEGRSDNNDGEGSVNSVDRGRFHSDKESSFLNLERSLRGNDNNNNNSYNANTGSSPSRHLSSQLTGCCYTYTDLTASDMCSLYNQDCESGETPSHDSGDENCEQDGLSFIGISFSVNTASGNPYSYQLCDQFPMENIIDRSYEWVMSMDEDGWLVGGGYKSFDYSGKMP